VAEKQFPRVSAYVAGVIEQSSKRQEFRDLLLRLMSRPGRVLCSRGPAEWPAYVLYTSQALGGDERAATIAAGAIEFIVGSTDVVDDLVDDEWPSTGEGWARLVNASHSLAWLGARCIGDLIPLLGPGRAALISHLIAENAVGAYDGEDMDLLLERRADVTAEDVHEMTWLRSGSLIALACQVGAAVATDDADVLSVVGEFGRHVGVIGQALNDVGGVLEGSDLRQRKKTLPVAYALRCARDEGLTPILAWYGGEASQSKLDERELSVAIRDLGALHYAGVVADAHRRRALGLVRKLARATGRAEVHQMKQLVPVVWSGELERRV
jgi:geranylgeranyl pyrophosphate synthase